MTVKDFLYRELSYSRKLIIRLKQHENGIMHNGRRVTVRSVLFAGDILELFSEDKAENGNIAANYELLDKITVLYEDENILAVAKPPFMPTHPSIKHHGDTLANAITAYMRLQGDAYQFRAVNRLDRNTSGIVLIAKHKDAAAKLGSLTAEKLIEKHYTAILCGDFNDIDMSAVNQKFNSLGGSFEYKKDTREGIITAPIKRGQESIILRICAPDGEYASTRFRIVCTKKGFSYAAVYPLTGRTHQIRLHFSAAGYPLLFDDLYGANKFGCGRFEPRHMLHAGYTGFTNPYGGEIRLFCPLPEDMEYFRYNFFDLNED